MPCGHTFCNECWSGYIKTQVEAGIVCIAATCPDSECTEIITEEEVERHATHDILSKFESYQVKNFIGGIKSTRWCPGPGCNYIAYGSWNTPVDSEVHCSNCSISFCLDCGDEPHKPLKCKDLEVWHKNFETYGAESWILKNTQACPGCHVRIEKNQGCSHMTCRECRHEFCWICRGKWKSHHKCNRFSSGPAEGKEKEHARSLHYFTRYHTHAAAQRIAKNNLEILQNSYLDVYTMMEPMSRDMLSTAEMLEELLIKANDLLVQCRKTLKYTYMYGYFHLCDKHIAERDLDQENVSSEQFDYHQEMLERFTEELTELTERPHESIDRLKLIDKTVSVKQFFDRIVESMMHGI